MSKRIHTNHQIKSVIINQREWFSCTASSLFHLLYNLELNAAIQDFTSRFIAVDRIVHFLIGHCSIITKMYYFHVFLSHSVLSLSRGAFLCAHGHIQSARGEYQIKRAKLVVLKWPNAHKMTYPHKHCRFCLKLM